MELIKRINWVDIIALILLLRISYSAFQQGLSRDFLSAIGIALNTVISLCYYGAFGQVVSEFLPVIPVCISDFVSFIAQFLLISLLLKLFGFFFDKMVKIKLHAAVEAVGGLISGVLRASITISLIFIILMLLPIPYFQQSIRDKSLTGMLFLRVGPALYGKAGGYLPGLGFDNVPPPREDVMEALLLDKSVPLFQNGGPKRRELKWW